MLFTPTHPQSEIKPRPTKALALILVLTLVLLASPTWASSEPSSIVTAEEATSAQSVNTDTRTNKKKDLTGFFTIGAIINILFLGAFILWARKESQKKKEKKSGAKH